MLDVIIELAGEHPVIFLALLGFGLLAVVILFMAAVKITRLILRVLVFLFTVGLVIILSIVTLVAAEHIYAALTYVPPEDPQPAYDTPPSEQSPTTNGQPE